MNRKQFETYVQETYNADAEHPWAPDTSHTVFRHRNNRKWFAVIMEIPKARLGINDDGMICIVNLKCDPMMIGSFLCEDGIYPAYHMNKTHWLSVALDGRANEESLKFLLDVSFDLTAKKITKSKRNK